MTYANARGPQDALPNGAREEAVLPLVELEGFGFLELKLPDPSLDFAFLRDLK